MIDIRPIRTEQDYDWALAEIETYFEHEPEAGTPEADRFDILAELIAAYEANNWPIDPPDPIEAVLYRMEIANLTQSDLALLLGSRSRASEILSRRRPLTIGMAYKLSREWRIPAEALIAPYHVESPQSGAAVPGGRSPAAQNRRGAPRSG